MLSQKESEWLRDRALGLKGAVVADVVISTDGCIGLVLLDHTRPPRTTMRTAWVTQDPEGNGPGWLDIGPPKEV